MYAIAYAVLEMFISTENLLRANMKINKLFQKKNKVIHKWTAKLQNKRTVSGMTSHQWCNHDRVMRGDVPSLVKKNLYLLCFFLNGTLLLRKMKLVIIEKCAVIIACSNCSNNIIIIIDIPDQQTYDSWTQNANYYLKCNNSINRTEIRR